MLSRSHLAKTQLSNLPSTYAFFQKSVGDYLSTRF